MAVDTIPEGFPTIPILATAEGNRLYAFLQQVFDAKLLDRPGHARRRTLIDPFGNQWTIGSRIEQISVAELHRRLQQPHA